ncbi:MAG TPA: hypothetical protein VFJ84_03595 [Candidatus Saccharimonadales bacterium]|nr:hypothetical protein [Candidatus Saccharimonadales bacterium]
MAQIYDSEDLKKAEEKSYSPGGLSSSTQPGKIRYSSSGSDSGTDSFSTSTSGGEVNYDSSQQVPPSERSLYSSSSTASGRVRFGSFYSTKPRKFALGGGIATLAIASIISFFAVGPLQVIHASQILQHPFSKQDNDSSNRISKLFRLARNKDIGETRVGTLGSKYFGRTIGQLEDAGVNIERGPTGSPTKITYDTEKLKSSFPELEGMSPDERASFLSEKIGFSVDPVSGSSTKFSIDPSRFDIKSARLLTKSTVGLLDNGKIVTGLKTRVLAKFFNLPSLFHPLSRAIADKENNIANAAQRKKAQQQDEAKRESSVTEPIEIEGESAVKDIKDKSGKYNSTVMKALLFTGGACFIRDISGDIIKVNHDLVVLPAAARATDLIAIGAQAKSGHDVSMSQVGEVVGGFSNKDGQSIWQGQAMQALINGGKADQKLAELPPDYSQAFSGDTTAAQIKSWANDALGGSFTAGLACSKVGVAVQIAAGLFAAASSAIAEIGSAGTLTPAIAAGWVAKEGLSFAVSAIAMHFVSGFILNGNTAKLAADAFSGPVGGDLLAYGARAAANTAAIASGGIALGNNASTILAENEQKQEDQQFRSQSWLARLFNPYDYRSAVAKLIDSTSPSPVQDVSKIGSIFADFGSVFTHSLSSIFPKAHAAEKPYDWGFSQYGLPDSILKDPNLSDPYQNADQAAKLLDGSDGGKYIKRANDCFGVAIKKVTDSDGKQRWDVIPDHDITPTDESYKDCSDESEDWHRIIMFVFDTSTMKAAACYQGDEQSCADLSSGTNPDTVSTPSGGGSGSLPQGSSKDLAAQLVPYVNQGKINCAFSPGCSDIVNTATGASIKGGQGCLVDALQPQLLGMLLKLVQMGHTFTLSALCSDHHNDGMNGHAGGKAADFNTIDGVFIGPSDSIQWSADKITAAQKLDQDVASFMPTSTGFGQQQCHPAFSFLSGYNLFDDGCSHQHIQVASP